MDQNTTALERAFELARAGTCGSFADIRRALKSEGYSDDQVVGTALRKQLTALMNEAKVKHKRAQRPQRRKGLPVTSRTSAE